MYSKPLIVHERQRRLYLYDWFEESDYIAQKLTAFSDLIKAPEEVITLDMSPYALWTAAAKGINEEQIVNSLEQNSQNEISESFKTWIRKCIRDFGTLEFRLDGEVLELEAKHEELINQIKTIEAIQVKIIREPSKKTLQFMASDRVEIKKILFEYDLFVKDAAHEQGDYLEINLSTATLDGRSFDLKDFQLEAANAFLSYNKQAGGGGTIIMPPNSGKTLMALKIIQELKISTLVIVENDQSAERWKTEILDKTDISEEKVIIHEGNGEKLQPITIVEYRTIWKNMELFNGFGLIIYDDAHKLPTDKNELTVNLRSKYKLAMASTLARSDEAGIRVLALVGPKWYEVLPRTLIKKGYQVPVQCIEVKVPLSEDDRKLYSITRSSNELRSIASLNENKDDLVKKIIMQHSTRRILIVSYLVEMTNRYENKFKIYAIKGGQKEREIEEIKALFNNKEISKLVASSIKIERTPLQDLDVIIAVSYHQGSEREEYLRIGKLVEAAEGKKQGFLYSLVSMNTIEEHRDYFKRRRNLINYGYRYKILKADELS